MTKEARPHAKGMRKAGTKNMQKPVAMPMGGIRSFFAVTTVRPSRTRQSSTPAKPTSDTTTVNAGEG